MDKSTMAKLLERKRLEESFRQEFEATLSERVDRYLDVKPHPLIADRHFAPVSSGCSLLFRDGHFYGCVALTQAVAEALVRFLCEKNGWRPGRQFERNVATLRRRGAISSELERCLLEIWKDRDDFHHLNDGVVTDRENLEKLAREKAILLAQVEAEVFGYGVDAEGRMIPTNPKYWDRNQDLVDVYLRFEP